MMDFQVARIKMVESQLRTTDVTSHSVLNAFLTVPREAFVPEKSQLLAYVDQNIQIAPAEHGNPPRYLMEPSPLAKMLQLAAITKSDAVLEVGAGTGYVSALLSHLAGSVTALECDTALADKARETLSKLGYAGVNVVTGNLEAGYASGAPYDLIFVSGAVEEVPQSLLSQLQSGGRLIAVQGYGHSARVRVFTRDRDAYSENVFFNASLRPLPGFRKAAEFVF